MKTFSFWALLLFPFFLSAQSSSLSNNVKNLFKDVPMGISLADFKKVRPKAIVTSDENFRTIVEEKNPQKGVELLTYYFDNEGSKPFYEVIIDFENEASRDKVAQQIFGKPNHPNKELENHWLIYKGDKGYRTVGWTYSISLIFAGNVPLSEWANDKMFEVPESTPDIDLRINKNDVIVAEVVDESPKTDTNGSLHTCENYAQQITQLFDSGLKITMPSDSIADIFPAVKKSASSSSTRDEYVLDVESYGMKKATFIFDPDDKKELFQAIFEFEDADSTLNLAQLMFGTPTHPTLDNHWVLGITDGENGSHISSLAWVYENKLVVAANLPGTDLENDEDFKFTDEFIKDWQNRGMVDVNDDPKKTTTDEESMVQQLNTIIASSLNNFDGVQGDFKPDNPNETYTNFDILGIQDCITRKNAAGNWRLEARFPPFENMDDAKTTFENFLNSILNLEGLEYRLVKKTDMTTKNGRTYICDIQTLDDKSLGVILKLQMYPTSNQEYGVKLEIGK